jgi:hypothetical protein
MGFNARKIPDPRISQQVPREARAGSRKNLGRIVTGSTAPYQDAILRFESSVIALANFFLVGFTLDGALSLLDELFGVGMGTTALAAPRFAVGICVLLATFPTLIALAFDPRLPKRVLLPMIAFLFWGALGGPPLSSAFDSPQTLGLALTGIQVGLAIAGLTWIHHRSRFGHWILHPDDLHGPRFRFAYTLRFAAGTLLLAPPILTLFVALACSEQIEKSTGGFITFDRLGIHSVTREYRKGDSDIHLVGMMHVGEGNAYREIFRTFAGESTLILAEGVSDEGGLLGTDGLYEMVADEIGLTVQPDFEHLRETMPRDASDPPWPDIRNADVDAAVFSEETIAMINAIGEINHGADLRQTLAQFQETYADRGPELGEIVLRDLIALRNDFLLDEMRGVLSDYDRIVVPWGALHLPGIEKAILDWGFEPVGSSQQQLVSYATVLAVLFAD